MSKIDISNAMVGAADRIAEITQYMQELKEVNTLFENSDVDKDIANRVSDALKCCYKYSRIININLEREQIPAVIRVLDSKFKSQHKETITHYNNGKWEVNPNKMRVTIACVKYPWIRISYVKDVDETSRCRPVKTVVAPTPERESWSIACGV